jgi:hypothetical protein
MAYRWIWSPPAAAYVIGVAGICTHRLWEQSRGVRQSLAAIDHDPKLRRAFAHYPIIGWWLRRRH